MAWLSKAWAWIAGVLGGAFAVAIGLFVAHRKGVAEGKESERDRQGADNREAMAAALRRRIEEDEKRKHESKRQKDRAAAAADAHRKVDEWRKAQGGAVTLSNEELTDLERQLAEIDRRGGQS